MLLQEMQHRVANSLQIIASILLLKARAVQCRRNLYSRATSLSRHQRALEVAGHQEAPYPGGAAIYPHHGIIAGLVAIRLLESLGHAR
jgi:hypothetical protein